MATSTIKGTVITQIFYETSSDIGTTEHVYSVNWQDYDLLVFATTFYNNNTSSMTVPVFYFAVTSSGSRPIIHDADTTITYNAYQKGEGSIGVLSANPDSRYRLKIYGIKFK